MGVASEFLTLLWGLIPPGQVLVWRLPSKHSNWFQHWENVDAFVAAHEGEDIYTGVSLVRKDAAVTGATRTNNVNAAGITGLWADIDIADPVHKKQNLPPAVEDALALLSDPPPTIVIHSGHGLQCWWLFAGGPWLFEDTAARVQAQTLSQWWWGQLAARFATKGWTLDPLHDLARVMRLPGTVNHKAEPRPVEIIHPIGERIALAPLLANLPPPRRAVAAPTSNGQRLTLNPDAVPPAAKLAALIAISPKFRQSWMHRRKEMLDQSASSYDMSLATLASQAEWTDQELADLMIAHRRQHGEDLKLREDYYQRTIDRARRPTDETMAVSALADAPDTESTLEVISRLLGIQIEAMYRYDSNPVTFGVMVSGREVRLGEADGINSQAKFRDKLAGASLTNVKPLSKEIWQVAAQKLLTICETIDLGEETRPADELRHLLFDYLAEYQPYDDPEQAIKQKRAFYILADDDRQIALNLPAFVSWIQGALHRNLKRTDVTIWLRSLGVHPERVGIPNYGQANVWLLPTDIGKVLEQLSV